MRIGEHYRKDPTTLAEQETMARCSTSRKQPATNVKTSPGSNRNPRKPNLGRPTPWKNPTLQLRSSARKSGNQKSTAQYPLETYICPLIGT